MQPTQTENRREACSLHFASSLSTFTTLDHKGLRGRTVQTITKAFSYRHDTRRANSAAPKLQRMEADQQVVDEEDGCTRPSQPRGMRGFRVAAGGGGRPRQRRGGGGRLIQIVARMIWSLPWPSRPVYKGPRFGPNITGDTEDSLLLLHGMHCTGLPNDKTFTLAIQVACKWVNFSPCLGFRVLGVTLWGAYGGFHKIRGAFSGGPL